MSDSNQEIPTHELYKKHTEEMEFHYWSFEGGADFLRRYLTKHAKESATDYAIRLKRAVYPNLVAAQITAYASQVYRSSVDRSVKVSGERSARIEQVVRDFWADADMMGNAADEFFEQVLTLLQRDGVCHVLVDRATSTSARTVADEEREGVRPYGVILGAPDLIDWQVDKRGRFVWALVRTSEEEERAPLSKREGDGWTYRLWTRSDSQVVNYKSGEWVRQPPVPHNLGVVPIASVFWGLRKGREPLGQSAIRDLAPMVLRLTNLLSIIDEEAFLQVFNMLCVGEDTFKNLSKTDWSTSGVVCVTTEEISPFYLAPDVSTIEALTSQINDTVRWIRMLSGNVGAQVDGGFVPPSGVSMSYQSSDKFALFKKIGGRLQDFELRVVDLLARWESGNPDNMDVSITYPVDFDPVMLSKTFEDSLAFAALGITGEPLVEVQVQAIRRMLNQSLTSEKLEELITRFREQSAGQQRGQTLGATVETPATDNGNTTGGLEL